MHQRRFYLPGTDKGVIRSTRPSVLPLANRYSSMHETLSAAAAAHAQHTAFVCGVSGRTRTFTEAMERADRYACLLHRDYGVRPGQRVLLVTPNTLDFFSIAHAVWRLGSVLCPTNPLQMPDEMAQLVAAAGGIHLIIGHGMVAPVVHAVERKLADAVQAPPPVLLYTDEMELPTASPLAQAPVQRQQPPSLESAAPAGSGLICVPFSSGTSGLPKGVRLSDLNLRSNVHQMCDFTQLLKMRDGDVVMSVLPMFHIYGLTAQLLASFVRGVTQVIVPRFDLEQYMGLVSRHRATVLFTVPPMLVAFAKGQAERPIDLSSVRVVLSGAAPLGKDMVDLSKQVFPSAFVTQGYGLTETSPVTHVNATGTPGSVGQLVADTEARLVDLATGQDVDAFGQMGEIWLRGPQVMLGYVNPADTAAVFSPDGFFKTGDIAEVDRNFEFFIRDRLKELIKVKGFQVAPAELEQVLLGHPFVADVIVIGVPTPQSDFTGNEAPRAHVVLNAAAVASAGLTGKTDTVAEALVQHVAEHLSPYKQLTGGVRFVETIPKSVTGKLLRRVARDLERQEAAREAAIRATSAPPTAPK
jgi:acyl-CoA synthetase (AMP-forming)/AMP-acid ligase II